jgi:sporulation protein YlmC with PRC-barrel domain
LPARHLQEDIDMTPRLLGVALAFLVAGALPAAADDIFLGEQKPAEYLARDRLLGINVHDKDGKVIGDIEDLIVDNDNKIVGAIIGVGGLLGVGEKKVAVGLAALHVESTGGKVTITLPAATKEALTAAPEYKRINPPKDWLQRATEKGEEIRDKSKDAYESAKEQAGPAIEKAKSAAKDAYETAKEQAGPALDKAKKDAQDAIDKAKQSAEPSDAPADAPKN